jgi:hypothetical protein
MQAEPGPQSPSSLQVFPLVTRFAGAGASLSSSLVECAGVQVPFMQMLPVLQSVSYMQAKAGAEQRQRIVAMIRLRMAVPLEPKNHTTKCPNLDRFGNSGRALNDLQS